MILILLTLVDVEINEIETDLTDTFLLKDFELTRVYIKLVVFCVSRVPFIITIGVPEAHTFVT
jgi:hypothetical protein